MPVLNLFDLTSQGFTLTEMTAAINKVPNRYSKIGSLGIFSDVTLHTNTAVVELKNNSLTILPTSAWGTPGAGAGPTKREIKSFVIPHTGFEDTVLAADIMGVRAFGTDSVYETFQQKVAEKLEQARNLFDMTDEYRKVCALQGKVVDADGTSTLFDSFDFFSITKKRIDFALGTTTTDVPKKILDLKRYIEDNLMGETMTSIRVFVGPDFYDGLIHHPSIKEIWLNWSGAPGRLASDLRSGFEIEGVYFEEYRGIVPKPDGSGTLQFIDNKKGVAIPLGTRNTFKRFLAPADYIDTVNTLAQPYYARQKVMDDDRGIRIYAQSNTLPICLRPNILVEVYTA
jgi:hypothetical protein